MAKAEDYLTTVISDIPQSDLENIILVLIAEAEIVMSSDFDARGNKYIIDSITTDFKHLPLYVIAGAFKKGSLGQFGTGRLNPRTIYGWMAEMSTAHGQKCKNIAESIDDRKKWDGLHQFPLGRAICKKIDWVTKGAMDIEDWDKVPLKELAEREAQRLESYPQLFGIINKKPKNHEQTR